MGASCFYFDFIVCFWLLFSIFGEFSIIKYELHCSFLAVITGGLLSVSVLAFGSVF